MKTSTKLSLGIAISLITAVFCYFWANALMDSLYAFRSPLAENPPAPGAPVGAPLTRRVVIVLIDALRSDTAFNSTVMPFLNELRGQAAWATMHSRPPSYSQTGYTMIFSGAWADVADAPLLNLDDDQMRAWTQDNLFAVAHRAGLKTAVSGYYWFGIQIPQTEVDASFYTRGEDAKADADVMQAAWPMLQDPANALVLVHIDQVDYAGHHEGGPRAPRWNAAATQADTYLREIVASLDLSQDTVLVISDHGQIERGGHGGQEPILLLEPFVLAGKGVQPGQAADIQMIDVAPTLAALLGTSIPASSEGRIRWDVLNVPDQPAALGGTVEMAQKTQLVAAYGKAIGASGQPSSANVNIIAMQDTLENAKNARLTAERLPRGLLALVLLLIPGIFLFRQPRKEILWHLGGALLVLVLFNLRYVFLSERTYSLTTVAGADDIIGYTAVTAGIAFALVWLGQSLWRGIFRKTPSQAALETLALALVTLYVISFFTLAGFAMNGLTITWTLPEFNTMFLGFLGMIQAIIISAAGLILTGLAALIALARQKLAA
jgi:hypothetical protein